MSACRCDLSAVPASQLGSCDACDRRVRKTDLACLMAGGAEGYFCGRCRQADTFVCGWCVEAGLSEDEATHDGEPEGRDLDGKLICVGCLTTYEAVNAPVAEAVL